MNWFLKDVLISVLIVRSYLTLHYMPLVFERPKPVGGASYIQYRRPEGG